MVLLPNDGGLMKVGNKRRIMYSFIQVKIINTYVAQYRTGLRKNISRYILNLELSYCSRSFKVCSVPLRCYAATRPLRCGIKVVSAKSQVRDITTYLNRFTAASILSSCKRYLNVIIACQCIS